MDASRQWGKSLDQISRNHTKRYEFAAKHTEGRTLDAACGCGYGASMLLGHAENVVGVDNSSGAIAWARAYFPGPSYLLGKIEESPWEGTFQTIVSLETVEHIKDPKEPLKAFRRSCLGKLIVSAPNEEKYKFQKHLFSNDESPHFRHYTPTEFQELLESCGFDVVEKHCQKSKWEVDVISGTEGQFLLYVCV